MRVIISIPMTHYYQLEVSMPIGNKENIDQIDMPELDKFLRAEVVNIKDKTIDRALWKIIDRLRPALPIPTTYRLWFNRSMSIEETITQV